MTWKEYADTCTNIYNELRKRGWDDHGPNSIATQLTLLYFTSGAYKNEPQSHEEE